MTDEKLRRGSRRWRRFLAVYSAVFLLLGAAGCCVLYRYAAAYEASVPERVMDVFMAETAPGQWKEIACRGAETGVSEFEDGAALVSEYYDAAVEGSGFSYRRDSQASGRDRIVFVVRGGGVDIAAVTLVPLGHNAAGFGRQLWQVGDVSSRLTLERLESVAVEIEAPWDETVYVNGVAVGGAYLTGEGAPPPDLTELESRFAEPPTFARYRIGRMYGDITVTDAAGRTLSPEREEGGVIRYVGREETRYSFTVRAPETVTVTVGGTPLLRTDASRAEYGVLAGLEDYTAGREYLTLTYAFDGLYTEPEITACAADGTELTPLVNEKGELIFFPPQDDALAAEARPWAERFLTRYVDYTRRAYDLSRQRLLLSAILPGTELYAAVRDSRDAMIWAPATEVTFQELTFGDFAPVGDGCFTCTIRYTGSYAETTWHQRNTYDMENAYELSFVRVGDLWYAAAMSAVSG